MLMQPNCIWTEFDKDCSKILDPGSCVQVMTVSVINNTGVRIYSYASISRNSDGKYYASNTITMDPDSNTKIFVNENTGELSLNISHDWWWCYWSVPF